MGHTPEPWIYYPHDSESQWAGNIVGHYSMQHPRSIRTITCQLRHGTPEEIEDNAHRIESCVNACGGYSKVNGEWVKTHERMADPAGEIARLRAEVELWRCADHYGESADGIRYRDQAREMAALSAKEAE